MASSEEIEKAISGGIVFRKAHDTESSGKVRTKARKKAYRTGAHGSAAAMKKADIRKHRAEKSRRKN